MDNIREEDSAPISLKDEDAIADTEDKMSENEALTKKSDADSNYSSSFEDDKHDLNQESNKTDENQDTKEGVHGNLEYDDGEKEVGDYVVDENDDDDKTKSADTDKEEKDSTPKGSIIGSQASVGAASDGSNGNDNIDDKKSLECNDEIYNPKDSRASSRASDKSHRSNNDDTPKGSKSSRAPSEGSNKSPSRQGSGRTLSRNSVRAESANSQTSKESHHSSASVSRKGSSRTSSRASARPGSSGSQTSKTSKLSKADSNKNGSVTSLKEEVLNQAITTNAIVDVKDLERKSDIDDNVSEKGSVKTEFIGNDDITREIENSDNDSIIVSDDDEKENEFVYELFDSSSDEEVVQHRLKRQNTKQLLLDYPTVAHDFDSLHLHDELLKGVYSAGFEKPTELQSKCLPEAMKWKDCIIQAPSGVGKSMVYVLSTLHLLPRTSNRASAISGVRVLVVCPTRELVASVHRQYQILSEYMTNVSILTLVGGSSVRGDKTNIKSMRPNVVIGTPGRISQSIKDKVLSLSQIKTLVIEQSDYMLNPAVQEFRAFFKNLSKKKKKKQVIMTCTTPHRNMEIVRKFTVEPLCEVLTNSTDLLPSKLRQYKVIVKHHDDEELEVVYKEKKEQLCRILDGIDFNQVVIFCNVTTTCSDLVNHLHENNFPVISIYGSMTQHDRTENHTNFMAAKQRILVASDSSCREVISKQVNLVINFEHPLDTHTYLHRVTKAVPSFSSKVGVAITLVQSEDELTNAEKEFGFTATELPSDLSVLLHAENTDKDGNEETTANGHKPVENQVTETELRQGAEATSVAVHDEIQEPTVESKEEDKHTESDNKHDKSYPATPPPAAVLYVNPTAKEEKQPEPVKQTEPQDDQHIDNNNSPGTKSVELASTGNSSPSKQIGSRQKTVMGFYDPSQKGPNDKEAEGSCTCNIL